MVAVEGWSGAIMRASSLGLRIALRSNSTNSVAVDTTRGSSSGSNSIGNRRCSDLSTSKRRSRSRIVIRMGSVAVGDSISSRNTSSRSSAGISRKGGSRCRSQTPMLLALSVATIKASNTSRRILRWIMLARL